MTLSRFLIGNPKDLEIDHMNRNPLDNRIENLRTCNRQQNACNTNPRKGSSKYKGVSWSKTRKKWASIIYHKGSQFNLGLYDNEDIAAEIYNKKSKELNGEFAYQNEIKA